MQVTRPIAKGEVTKNVIIVITSLFDIIGVCFEYFLSVKSL